MDAANVIPTVETTAFGVQVHHYDVAFVTAEEANVVVGMVGPESLNPRCIVRSSIGPVRDRRSF